MTNGKFTHLLLVALLCFSQLATSLHSVSHLRLVHSEDTDHSAHINSHTDTLVSANATIAQSQQEVSQQHPDSEPEGDDCDIYHACSQWNTAQQEYDHHVVVRWSGLPATTFESSPTASTRTKIQQVRAPPIIS